MVTGFDWTQPDEFPPNWMYDCLPSDLSESTLASWICACVHKWIDLKQTIQCFPSVQRWHLTKFCPSQQMALVSVTTLMHWSVPDAWCTEGFKPFSTSLRKTWVIQRWDEPLNPCRTWAHLIYTCMSCTSCYQCRHMRFGTHGLQGPVLLEVLVSVGGCRV